MKYKYVIHKIIKNINFSLPFMMTINQLDSVVWLVLQQQHKFESDYHGSKEHNILVLRITPLKNVNWQFWISVQVFHET